ncbi:hypothetical protein HYV80_01650 [Candidatus Woesearchaeota archaeon]|nr:hypothetical protein [Candidatus Woesearchaeota archaeon]
MAELTWNWIIVFFLLAVVAFIISYGYYAKGTGLFTKLADEVLKQQHRFLPVEPRKELKQDEKLPQKVIDSHQNFAQFIKSNIGQQEGKACRLEIPSMAAFEDFGMEFTNLNDNINLKITKIKSAEGYTSLNMLTVQNAKICLVNSENFYSCYIGPQRNCASSLYNDAGIITINNGEINTFREKKQLANQMIKFESNKFCFIPMHSGFLTRPGCDAGKTSLDNDCASGIIREIPICGRKIEPQPEALTENDRKAIAEFNRFSDFLSNLGQYGKLCSKNFLFDTNNIGSGYYIYFNPSGQLDLRLNKDGGKVIKRSSLQYIPYGTLSDDASAKYHYSNYNALKDTLVISPAGDYSTSDSSIAVVLDTSIVAVSNEENKWIITKPSQYTMRQQACA